MSSEELPSKPVKYQKDDLIITTQIIRIGLKPNQKEIPIGTEGTVVNPGPKNFSVLLSAHERPIEVSRKKVTHRI